MPNIRKNTTRTWHNTHTQHNTPHCTTLTHNTYTTPQHSAHLPPSLSALHPFPPLPRGSLPLPMDLAPLSSSGVPLLAPPFRSVPSGFSPTESVPQALLAVGSTLFDGFFGRPSLPLLPDLCHLGVFWPFLHCCSSRTYEVATFSATLTVPPYPLTLTYFPLMLI